MNYQEMEYGEAATVMKSFKELLDPGNLLNPGKIYY
jgi:D-lactate dehydrogenase (cytochrome)